MKIELKIVFMKKCRECKEDYDSREDNLGLRIDVCKQCNIKRMEKDPRLVRTNVVCKCESCRNDYDLREDNIGLKIGTCKSCNIMRLKNTGCNTNRQTRCKDIECERCFAKSFASHEKAMFWHPSKNEDAKPRDVARTCHNENWFKCDECGHDFEVAPHSVDGGGHWCGFCSNAYRCSDLDCLFCFEHSFAKHGNAKFWCLQENGDIRPRNVALNSSKKYWFKCEECRHKFSKALYSINSGIWCSFCANYSRCDDKNCQFCFNHSFASHEKAKFWHSLENMNVKPRDIALNDHDRYWFKCGECKHDFMTSSNDVNGGGWCGFCANLSRCKDENCQFCFDHSFASHEKAKFWHQSENGDVRPRDVAKGCDKKYWFKCGECHHNLYISPHKISTSNRWCIFCVNQSRCDDEKCQFCFNHSFASHEKAKFWHPTENGDVRPRDIALNSGKKYWFKCGECEHEFSILPSNVNANGAWCVMCRNKTEAKLNAFLNKIYGTVIYQFKVDWCKNSQTNRYFPFDFCLTLYKIIIELDGRQHFQDMEYWYSSADDIQDRDKYKMRMAMENGYSIIRISQKDVWKDTYDWQSDLLEAIKTCKNEMQVVFCSKDKDLYVNHK